MSGTPVRDARGHIVGAVTVTRDVTERRRNERAVREANRQMDAFLGVVSHELKTPVTAILLGLQLTRRRMHRLVRCERAAVGESSLSLEALADQLGHTSSQVERLDRLVNDLLDVSRIQAGKLEIRRTPADLTGIVSEAVEEHRIVKTLLEELSDLDPGAPPFEAKMKVLRETVLQHAEEEEKEMFAQAKQLPKEELETLLIEIEALKNDLEDKYSE